jgi:ring-1,2-phenylacetyl-CoA epoxidase subunit PaaD
MISKSKIYQLLNNVKDPEIPVVSVVEMGMIRNAEIIEDEVIITMTPTYSGCPATNQIRKDIVSELGKNSITNVKVKEKLNPAWTTDWMTDDTHRKLKEYGIAPPDKSVAANIDKLFEKDKPVQCPKCNSRNTEVVSRFGSTACKSQHFCRDCKEPFDYFKCH